MSYKSVQFHSKEQVLTAYDNSDVDTWAIFTDKERFMKGNSAEELAAALILLESGASNCTYTLRVYEDIDVKSLKTNAIADFGFNFKLNAPGMTVNGYNQASLDYRSTLVAELAAMRKEIKELKEGKEEENKLGLIGNILDHPVLGTIVENLGTAFINRMLPAATPNMASPGVNLGMRAVGNIATDTELVKAIEVLKQHDPNLTEHLKKLCAIAQRDPATFGILIASIDKITL